jgi:hypothetical protein
MGSGARWQIAPLLLYVSNGVYYGIILVGSKVIWTRPAGGLAKGGWPRKT